MSSSSSNFCSYAFVAVATLACAPAAAQTAPVDAPVPPIVAAEPAPSLAPESADAATARVAVARARELFRVGDFSAALAEFLRAHELLHDDPRQADVLNNIAVCYERMFRYELALQYYERYLRESTTASADDRAEVEGVMASLRDLLGTVRITGQRGAEVWIDDRMLGEVPLDVLVPAGLHVIEIRARNYEAQRRELRVTARGLHDVIARLELIERYRGLPSTYFWVGTSLTAAAAITGTAFGIAALNEDAAGDRDAEHMLNVDGQATKDLAVQADIAFGVALAFAAGTTVLYFLTDWGSTPEEQRSVAGTAKLSFGVTTDAVGLSLIGSTP
jgi:tetratricopeptide (TPR) repeat protein